MQSWKWIARYTMVLVVALLLGAAIAELSVFKQTTLGTPRLPAAALARFLGYGRAHRLLDSGTTHRPAIAQLRARPASWSSHASARIADRTLCRL